MEKISGIKLKMTQIWKGNDVVPVSVIKISKKEDLEFLKEGDLVKITGVTKGHGFQGVVKRYSFAGGPKTHGQKNRHRAPGSIGATAPQRVVPGMRMAGRMGADNKTIRNLKVVQIDADTSMLYVRGSVPGNNKGKLVIRKA